MASIKLGKISGGLDVPGFGTVTRAALMRPSKTLRDVEGRTFHMDASTRRTSISDESGNVVGRFQRDFWTRHGTLEWRGRTYAFRAGMWSQTYELSDEGRVVVSVKIKAFGGSELTVADDIDPALALITVALAKITAAYTQAAAAT